MYSLSAGLKPLRPFDAWFGAHQRLDRFALKELHQLSGDGVVFPSVKQLLEFEGINGPDGIKIKTPAQGEPWHFYNPYDHTDTQIFDNMRVNYKNLVKALRAGNMTRASFEAAWLAHAIVDGLTPAHHYPYEEELVRLRGGQGKETRVSYKEKLLVTGDTVKETLKNNWGLVGDKGLLSTHMMFEFGVAVMIVPMRSISKKHAFNAAEVGLAYTKDGYIKYFQKVAREIADMQLYQSFYKAGWTPSLGRKVRGHMVPRIIHAVTLAWFSAVIEASKKR